MCEIKTKKRSENQSTYILSILCYQKHFLCICVCMYKMSGEAKRPTAETYSKTKTLTVQCIQRFF